jgi:type VI secretion system secreted protein VgrG
MATRPITVTSPLGADVLKLYRMSATEQLGRLSRFELELLSTQADIKLDDLLGKPMSVALELPSNKARYLNGVVTRFAQTGRTGRFTQYHATLRPWLWLLTRTADCCILSGEAGPRTVPDIIKEVFRRNKQSDFKEHLHGTYKAREYCVQYRETDFDFVSRLMEEEGIYYYLEHEEKKHHIVLCDAPASHSPIPGCEKVPYMAAEAEGPARVDHISNWELAQELQSGMAVLNDYDFEIPRADLKVSASVSRKHPYADLEVYDYPGDYVGAHKASGEGTSGDGDAHDRGQGFARAWIEEIQADYERASGSGNVRGLAVGGLFTLQDFHREDQNRDYLVVSTTLEIQVGGFEGIKDAVPDTLVNCEFGVIPSKVQFRSREITPKPSIPGPQTATVVGKSGEEIWTDVHGRVKVQFHWDRKGGHDENSSCWVRVASPWAGKNWGAVHIPRIGHEVVVEFLEGDPDRPIITGSVYNGPNKPPYKLPDHQTQSGIKSRSTKDGSADNFNEIRFEDKKGEEQLFIHAERNQDIEVEKDETHTVGNDRTKTIGHDETTHVKNNRTETVDQNESITIGGGRTENVAKDESITISGSRTESVAKDEGITIQGARTESVSKDETITIAGGRTESVGKDEAVTIAGKRSKEVSKDESVTIGESYSQNVGKSAMVDVGKSLTIQAGDEIVLRSGSASITLKQSGDVTIEGGSVTVKASGNLTLKGSQIAQN